MLSTSNARRLTPSEQLANWLERYDLWAALVVDERGTELAVPGYARQPLPSPIERGGGASVSWPGLRLGATRLAVGFCFQVDEPIVALLPGWVSLGDRPIEADLVVILPPRLAGVRLIERPPEDFEAA